MGGMGRYSGLYVCPSMASGSPAVSITVSPASGDGAASSAPEARVLVVGGRPTVRSGLVSALTEAPGLHAVEAGTLPGTLRHVRGAIPPAAIVLRDSTEAVVRLHAERPSLPLIVVERRALRAVGPRLLRLGAAGVLAQAEAPGHLADAVRTVVRGERFVSPALGVALAEVVAEDAAPSALSDREQQVVTLTGQGLKRAEIAARMHVAPTTVTTYRKRAKAKLGLTTTTDLALYAVQQGWVLLDP